MAARGRPRQLGLPHRRGAPAPRREAPGVAHDRRRRGALVETTWDSEVVWEYEFCNDDQRLHHGFEPLPNGNLLAILAVPPRRARRPGPEAVGAGLWPDSILEPSPSGRTRSRSCGSGTPRPGRGARGVRRRRRAPAAHQREHRDRRRRRPETEGASRALEERLRARLRRRRAAGRRPGRRPSPRARGLDAQQRHQLRPRGRPHRPLAAQLQRGVGGRPLHDHRGGARLRGRPPGRGGRPRLALGQPRAAPPRPRRGPPAVRPARRALDARGRAPGALDLQQRRGPSGGALLVGRRARVPRGRRGDRRRAGRRALPARAAAGDLDRRGAREPLLGPHLGRAAPAARRLPGLRRRGRALPGGRRRRLWSSSARWAGARAARRGATAGRPVGRPPARRRGAAGSPGRNGPGGPDGGPGARGGGGPRKSIFRGSRIPARGRTLAPRPLPVEVCPAGPPPR